MSHYLSNSIAWSLFWMAVGYGICYVQLKIKERGVRGFFSSIKNSVTFVLGDKDRRFYILPIIVGIGMVVQQYNFQQEQDASSKRDLSQQTCLINQFSDLTDALNARNDIAALNTNAVARALRDVAVANGKGDSAGVQDALDAYQEDQRVIQKFRDDNPFPPFPNGKCDPE